MRKAWIAAASFAVVFSALAWDRWRIWSFGSDTGTFTQAILAAAHGWADGPEQGSHFFYHFSPVLALLYPLLALTHAPLALQIAQVLLIAATAPAFYALVAPYTDRRIAQRLAVLVLLYPPLTSLAFGEFHELAFLPVLLVLLLWAADRCRWGWFAVLALACLATREDVCVELSVVSAALALWCVARRGSAQRGMLIGEPRAPGAAAAAFATLSISGAVVAAAYYRWVLVTHGSWPHTHFYDYPFAHGPLAVLIALFTQPAAALGALAQPGRLTYLIEAFVPLALLPLFSRWLWCAVPGFVIVLLAAEQSVWRMGNHYAALWIPWVLVAAAVAAMRISENGGVGRAILWVNAAIAACVLTLVAFDPLHPLHYLSPPYHDLTSARAALACVPKAASVSTHDEWFAEIAGDYPNATIQRVSGPEYLVYADDFANDQFKQQMLPRIEQEVRDGQYRVACRFGQVKAYAAVKR